LRAVFFNAGATGAAGDAMSIPFAVSNLPYPR